MEFDHIAIAGETREAATRHVETALGVPLQPGGTHAVYGTHNALLGLLDGLYLEAIAVNRQAQPQQSPRWFDLDRFSGAPRLTNWICRCDDLDATLAALPAGFGTPVSLARGDLRWRMAVPADGVLPFDNCAPALMQWEGDAHPAKMLQASDLGMTALTVQHPDAAGLQALLMPYLSDDRIRFETGTCSLQARFDHKGVEKILA